MATKYKDSGIPWIGMIPSDWIVVPIKRVKDTTHPYPIGDGDHGSIKPEDYRDEGIPYIRVQNMSWGGPIIMDNIAYISEKTNELNKKSELHPNDILVAKTGATIGKTCIIPNNMPKANTTSSVGKVTVGKDYSSKFIFYLLGSEVCIRQMWLKAGQKSAQPGFNIDELVDFKIPVPQDLLTQQCIADLLDRKCAEIDELAALQETMIEELKRYKQSLITETVTKGLNPNAPMKDSGVEWIGGIPSHWKMKAVKYVLQRRNQKNDPIISEERLSLSIGIGITKYAEKTTNLDRFKDDFTQYQLAYPDDIVLNSMNMIVGAVGKSNYFGCVSPVYYVMKPHNSTEGNYYAYVLNTPTIRQVYHSLGKGIYAIERGEGRVNTCRLKVAFDDFGRIEIPVPPISEQQQIADFLDSKCAEIDELIAIKQQKIEALKEYKKSVIFEYVTGKKVII